MICVTSLAKEKSAFATYPLKLYVGVLAVTEEVPGTSGGAETKAQKALKIEMALKKQKEMQKQLQVQLQIQRNLQQSLEAHGKYLQNIMGA